MTETINVILITLCIAYLCMVNTHGKLKKNSIYNGHTDVTKMTANAKRVEWWRHGWRVRENLPEEKKKTKNKNLFFSTLVGVSSVNVQR